MRLKSRRTLLDISGCLWGWGGASPLGGLGYSFSEQKITGSNPMLDRVASLLRPMTFTCSINHLPLLSQEIYITLAKSMC